MFDPSGKPRVFCVPPGLDFGQALVSGLDRLVAGRPPEALARLELWVNTRRMQRRLAEIYDHGPARLLPCIRVIPDLGRDTALPGLPPAVSPLRRRLELSQLVARLLDREPDLAPRASIYDLADSLAGLMDEMQGEGVTPADLARIEVAEHSDHWARSLKFLSIVAPYFAIDGAEPPDTEARQRMVIDAIAARWENDPPPHPVIVAGSTGSRGATARFMHAVARLPQGALVLPGFDTDLPDAVWHTMQDALSHEDHPQFRFARLMQALEINRSDIGRWVPDAPVHPVRNRMVSLALRPAPVTDQWLAEAPGYDAKTIAAATADMSLLEAASPREEAGAIALILRAAAEDGRPAALITPDRMLTRQVASALDRWGIEPDDSAGEPLTQTAPGRFLRHVTELAGQPLTAPALLALLKHPICATGEGPDARGTHLRFTRDLELGLLRRGLPFPTAEAILAWVDKKHAGDMPRRAWSEWLIRWTCGHVHAGLRPLADHLADHIDTAEALARGPGAASGAGTLWDRNAGRESRRIVDQLLHEAEFGGRLDPGAYRDLFHGVLQSAEARDPLSPHSLVRIWGTLEARVQGADLVILAGLNDGTWPDLPGPDPWLNRRMRHEIGLLLPERRIGLAAHDFQQAIAAPEVVLSRAIRDAEAETVPSRWLNRLTNLLGGMSDHGEAALKAMRARGTGWLVQAAALDARSAVAPAQRPSPRPPVEHRPKELSVTRVTRLVRDPYAIYAAKILRLSPLDPLAQSPDAPLRGTILHHVLDRFISERDEETSEQARARLIALAAEVLERDAPWPATRALWLARLEKVADRFIAEEAERRAWGAVAGTEVKGRITLDGTEFRLIATADRIDRAPDGVLAVYDYKSGEGPKPKDRKLYDKQIEMEAVIAETGGFGGLPAAEVSRLAYIGMGANAKFTLESPKAGDIARVVQELTQLVLAYEERTQGYTAHRIDTGNRWTEDYDHLARLGEWDLSDLPTPEDVG